MRMGKLWAGSHEFIVSTRSTCLAAPRLAEPFPTAQAQGPVFKPHGDHQNRMAMPDLGWVLIQHYSLAASGGRGQKLAGEGSPNQALAVGVRRQNVVRFLAPRVVASGVDAE